ncbi:hypothetical protein [Clostridium thailandense]
MTSIDCDVIFHKYLKEVNNAMNRERLTIGELAKLLNICFFV